MTELELQAIRERAEKATAGPWEFSNDGEVYTEDRDYNHAPGIAETEHLYDADFIANARQDVPQLIDIVEDQAKTIESLRANAKYNGWYVEVIEAELARLRKFVDTVSQPLDLVATAGDGRQFKLEGVVFNFEEAVAND